MSFFAGTEDKFQPHEERFRARLENFEDYLRKLNVEETWPIHETHCTIPKIHKPTKQEFTEKCMEPGVLINTVLYSEPFNSQR